MFGCRSKASRDRSDGCRPPTRLHARRVLCQSKVLFALAMVRPTAPLKTRQPLVAQMTSMTV